MVKQTVPQEVPHVPRAPPPSTNLNKAIASDPPIALPLDQLWKRLTSDRQQEILQRLTRMMVQQLAPSGDPREANHE